MDRERSGFHKSRYQTLRSAWLSGSSDEALGWVSMGEDGKTKPSEYMNFYLGLHPALMDGILHMTGIILMTTFQNEAFVPSSIRQLNIVPNIDFADRSGFWGYVKLLNGSSRGHEFDVFIYDKCILFFNKLIYIFYYF